MIRTNLFVLLTFAACSLGCGGYTHETVSVSGVVLMEGKPVPYVEVAFESGNKPAAFGITDENGRYELATRRYGAGVLPGDYTIKIHPVKASANDGKGTTMEIPEAYSRSSVKDVRVDNTQAQTVFDLDLSSTPSKKDKKKPEDSGEASSSGVQ